MLNHFHVLILGPSKRQPNIRSLVFSENKSERVGKVTQRRRKRQYRVTDELNRTEGN
jgi:hypothetical protein